MRHTLMKQIKSFIRCCPKQQGHVLACCRSVITVSFIDAHDALLCIANVYGLI